MHATSAAVLSLLIVASAIPLLASYRSFRTDRRPRVYGDRVPKRALSTAHRRVQKKITSYHNFFRSRVSPPAADMLAMTWHKGAARAAQRWSDQCLMLVHDDVMGRSQEDFGTCGQNIFISTQQVPWFFAIKMWFLEKYNFTYGSPHNDLEVVGHYTQMVWSATHRVGCGFTKCHRGGLRGKPFFNYVCNYCPIGNYRDRLGRPYKKGRPCSKCAGHCRQKKLCTNGCPTADLWANCRELNSTWHGWLCDDHTEAGRERHGFCKATCGCRGKIF